MDPITLGNSVVGAVQLARQTMDTADSYMGGKSLIDVSAVARVEPLLIVDADVMNLDYISDITQTMQSLFSGYYLQALDIITKVGGVSVASKLGPLNPNNHVGLLGHQGDWRMATESYTHRLPTQKNKIAMALEADKVTASFDKDANKTMMDASNLSVGKLYNVTLKEGDNAAVIKVAIRVMAASMPTSSLIDMFSFKNKFDMDLKERYHAWKAGRLGFIKDLVLCQDLIEKHRKHLIKDKSGIYQEIVNRQAKGLFAGLVNKNPSMAIASNLAIISSDTAEQIQTKFMGKFSNFQTRQQIFDNTNLMILAVVDKAFERISFYHRGISQTSEMSLRDIRVSNKGNGSEVADIMKAFISGNAPSL